MDIIENSVQGKWREMKIELQKAWARLTNHDLDKPKREPKTVGDFTQKRYVDEQENANRISKLRSNLQPL